MMMILIFNSEAVSRGLVQAIMLCMHMHIALDLHEKARNQPLCAFHEESIHSVHRDIIKGGKILSQ